MGFQFEEIKNYLMLQGLNPLAAEKAHAIYGTQRIGGTANAYFVLIFTDIGIYIVSLTPMGKLGNIIAVLEKEQIQWYEFKKKLLMGYRLSILMDDGKGYHFHVNKSMIGAGWHKQELKEILDSNYYHKKMESSK